MTKLRIGSLALLALVPAECGAHRSKVEAPAAKPADPAPVAAAATPAPKDASTAAPLDLPVPQPGPNGQYQTINSGIDAQEAEWHLRAALNVAALSCRNDASIATHYNALLTARKPLFTTAYTGETRRYAGAALDRHMTQLYNFFALPYAIDGFCAAAAIEAPRAAGTSAADFPAYAPDAVARLQAPITHFYDQYNSYRQAYAAWKAGQTQTAAAAPPAAPPAVAIAKAEEPKSAAAANSTWRIQLGAFTGQKAAEAAWAKARAKLPSLAEYEPHYEPVPKRPTLVRLQIGAATDRAGALKLCATAAAGGFDCLPLGH